MTTTIEAARDLVGARANVTTHTRRDTEDVTIPTDAPAGTGPPVRLVEVWVAHSTDDPGLSVEVDVWPGESAANISRRLRAAGEELRAEVVRRAVRRRSR